ncbi:glycosyltransferase family 2 protein [Paenibacillus radicis (ex Gao et al. 2016)]|uniref:Glycosyl transferase n=1 Tax=Paenibacillus radicis (ex Gao et al. 2016) TaxID=1737354 RepID=A0A917HVT5_9BACL|nr:glycosyltransferase [Paenibacillus radicis (ex Gao et al. 2016)]GGG91002.1 glycosyl transferase [Paenibacillus radicis (ex Gao et al. 2016)]
MKNKNVPGVTIITSTIRPKFIHQIFQNYVRQKWAPKELIIVLNKNAIAIDPYLQLAQQYPGVTVLRQPQSKRLGACLNYAAARAKYPYIAKFDDDDYYAPSYIPEAMGLFAKKKADLVGKRTCFFYMPHRSLLLLRQMPVRPYSRCRKIAGATIMFHRRVFKKVKFSTKVRQGSDVRFVKASIRKGFRVFTTSPYNFAAIRRANRNSHTWKISDKRLLAAKKRLLLRTRNYKHHVNRSLDQLKGIQPYPIPVGVPDDLIYSRD